MKDDLPLCDSPFTPISWCFSIRHTAFSNIHAPPENLFPQRPLILPWFCFSLNYLLVHCFVQTWWRLKISKIVKHFLSLMKRRQQKVSCKKAFLSMNLQILGLQHYKKKRLWHRCLLANFENSLMIAFCITPRNDCIWPKPTLNAGGVSRT